MEQQPVYHKPTRTAAQVSEQTSLYRLDHVDKMMDHIIYDHEASESLTPGKQAAIEKVKAAIKEAKMEFTTLELLKA